MRFLLIYFILLVIGFFFLTQAMAAGGFKNELYYSNFYCDTMFHGKPTTLKSGIKPDCETEFAVIEFDWAKSPKHYECIGQALIYASETAKLPVCVLLARTSKEISFGYSIKRKPDLKVKMVVLPVVTE